MGKIALLLLVAAGLIIFGVQNQTPVALVVLGAQTLAVPLAVWVLGALGAGALTTLLLSGFFSLSKAGAVRRAAQRLSDSRSPWGGVGTKRGAAETSQAKTGRETGFRAANRRSEEPPRRSATDDWEQSDIDRETWDDWGEPTPCRPSQPTARTTNRNSSRDTDDEDWRRRDNQPTDDSRREPRTEFTAPPVDRYREADPPERGSERRSGVYDAEYRVLVPPYSSQPPPPPQPAPEPDPLDDDWGLDDDLNPKK